MSKKLLKMIAGVSAGLFLFGAGSEVVGQATNSNQVQAASAKKISTTLTKLKGNWKLQPKSPDDRYEPTSMSFKSNYLTFKMELPTKSKVTYRIVSATKKGNTYTVAIHPKNDAKYYYKYKLTSKNKLVAAGLQKIDGHWVTNRWTHFKR